MYRSQNRLPDSDCLGLPPSYRTIFRHGHRVADGRLTWGDRRLLWVRVQLGGVGGIVPSLRRSRFTKSRRSQPPPTRSGPHARPRIMPRVSARGYCAANRQSTAYSAAVNSARPPAWVTRRWA